MEEVDDAYPEEIPQPELKRSENSLREKVECPDCGKKVSKHTLQYGSHKKHAKEKRPLTVWPIRAPTANIGSDGRGGSSRRRRTQAGASLGGVTA